jgi:transposase
VDGDGESIAGSESLQPGVGVSDVARRYGVSRGLLQTWRRTAMRMAVDQGSVFVPLRMGDEPSAAPVDPAADSAVATATGLIEFEGSGLRVRFSGAVDTGALRLVLGHFGRRN